MRWFAQHIGDLVVLLAIVTPLLGRVLKELAGRQHKGDESAQPRVDAPAKTAPSPSASRPATPSRASRQEELAARRQAQIEMWKARDAAARGGGAERPSQAGGEDELLRRRRIAMEELRRRQSSAGPAQSHPTPPNRPVTVGAPMSRRDAARAEMERRRQAAMRRAAAPRSEARQVVREVVASLEPMAAARVEAVQATVVPAARTTSMGALVLTPASLRQAFVMKELLDPPVGLREGSVGGAAGYDETF